MRWQRLFDDLEGQFAAADGAELAAEIAERTRIELGRQTLAARLRAGLGRAVTVAVAGQHVTGRLIGAGADVVLIDEGGCETVVAVSAVTAVMGLDRASAADPETPEDRAVDAARQARLSSLLRAVAIDRAPCRLRLIDETTLTGTIDMVAVDYLELAQHPLDEPRRAAAVASRRIIPLAGLAIVRPG